jgi:single-stranded DNA-specific DHH superfamily exonuclease
LWQRHRLVDARELFEEHGIDRAKHKSYLTSLLKLVAIASIADVVPLVGENRMPIVKYVELHWPLLPYSLPTE